jgi:hypothetical protein
MSRLVLTILAVVQLLGTPSMVSGQSDPEDRLEAVARFNQAIKRAESLGFDAASFRAVREIRTELQAFTAPDIYLGRDVSVGEHTDAVAVLAGGRWSCSGTLIARDFVVTAGHCETPVTHVLFGSSVATGERIRVINTFPHPPPAVPSFDRVLLLRLERTPQGATPVRRATNDEIEKRTYVHAVGFGSTNDSGTGAGLKRTASLRILSYHCNGNQKGIPDSTFYPCEQNREIVAGEPGGADTCKGDSGGPLYIGLPGNAFALAGITRRGVTAACGSGGVYMRINKYSIWLKKYIP